MRKIVAFFLLPLLLSAADPSLYLWHRKADSAVAEAAKKFFRYTAGKLYCLAGELNNDRTITVLPVPEFILPHRTVPTVRIHVRNITSPPEELARIVAGIYRPWQQCGELQIDLDAPESRLELYAGVMAALRKQLAGVKLSATVLPCHLRHRSSFRTLARQCDYFVLQLHALQNDGEKWQIIDRQTAITAMQNGVNIGHPFKIALPLYSHFMPDGSVVKPDLFLVSRLADLAARANAGVIGFRLGRPGEYTALDLPSALAVCRGLPPQQTLGLKWEKAAPGVWHLQISNCGYFPEKSTLALQWENDFHIEDADAISGARLSFDRTHLELLLPPAGETRTFLWLRCDGKYDLNLHNPLTITRKETVSK